MLPWLKSFTTSSEVSRYPNGVLVHTGCVVNKQGWKFMSCRHCQDSRVVSTIKLAPDWLHMSEQPIRSHVSKLTQPIRSQVSKLTQLLTMTTTLKSPLQDASRNPPTVYLNISEYGLV